MSKAEVLIIKIGEVAQLTFADGSQYESAIRKQPVASQPNFFTTPRSGGSEKPAKGAKNRGFVLKKSSVILNFSF